MTSLSVRVKVRRKSVVKCAANVRFPAQVTAEQFIKIARANGVFAFGVDYEAVAPGVAADPDNAFIVVLDTADGIYKRASLSDLVAATTQIDQHVTSAGPVTINLNSGIVRVDQVVSAPITLTLPLASEKTCPVLISDWKGDAGTNNITIALSGSDTFPGGATSWKISSDTGSIFARPVPGVGYVL